jgi:hypothetical protein
LTFFGDGQEGAHAEEKAERQVLDEQRSENDVEIMHY